MIGPDARRSSRVRDDVKSDIAAARGGVSFSRKTVVRAQTGNATHFRIRYVDDPVISFFFSFFQRGRSENDLENF